MATILATYSGGGTLWDPGVEVQDGDAVIWFYREASGEVGPTARMCALSDSGGTEISFSYYNKGNWGAASAYDYYISSVPGNLEFDSGGAYVVDDTIYAVFDQFTGFTAGNHYVKFNLPGVSRARVEAAHLLRGVTAATPGTYLYSEAEPYRMKVYDGSGAVSYNGFPTTVPLGGTSSLIYCLWYMTLGISPPAGFTSVSGTQIAAYTYYDPTDTPSLTQTIIAYRDGLTGASVSQTAPTETGWSGSPGGTSYQMDVLVIDGGAAIATGPTVYFADLLVFNAKSGAVVEY